MYDNYLIPANTKRGQLILGMFKPFDLILFGCGVLVTLILVAVLPMSSTFVTILAVSPGIVTAFLVMPVPYYHNILNIIVELYQFFFVNPRQYEWKGWCYKNGKRK